MRDASQLASNCLGEQLGAGLVQVTAIVLINVKTIIEYPRRIEEINPWREAVSTRFDEKGIDDLRFRPTRGRLRTVGLEVVAFAEPLVGMQNMQIGRPYSFRHLRHREG